MSKRQKTIPKFSDEAAERAFWEKNDSAQYLDWSKARPAAFPNLKPSTKTISLRLPEHLLDAIKVAANARDNKNPEPRVTQEQPAEKPSIMLCAIVRRGEAGRPHRRPGSHPQVTRITCQLWRIAMPQPATGYRALPRHQSKRICRERSAARTLAFTCLRGIQRACRMTR